MANTPHASASERGLIKLLSQQAALFIHSLTALGDHMPLYEYHCTECGENTEILQKLSDAPEKICPSCHKDGLTKQISAPRFELKGSGWYVTDFRDKKDKPKSTKPETSPETKTEIKSTDTSEIKTPEKPIKAEKKEPSNES